MTAFHTGSKNRLTPRSAHLFPGDSLFDRLARAVCSAGCLPRKELYEAWEVARRARRHFRGGRVVDLAAGHGLLASILLLLDDTSPRALCVDPHQPPSAAKLRASLETAWPRLAGRVTFTQGGLQDVPLDPGDLVVAAHACGSLTDLVLERAVTAGARVAVLPCCHPAPGDDARGLSGWLDHNLALDVTRVTRLQRAGYHVWTQTISPEVTPKNRLILAQKRPTPSM